MDTIARYAKAITALIGAVGTALVAGLQDGSLSGPDWLAIVLAVLTPAGVAAVRNRPGRVKASIHDA